MRVKSDKTFSLPQLPYHKKIPNTNYLVDCFNVNVSDFCIYFLSHYHADHYIGLNKKFTSLLYCSITTGNLVIKNLRVNEKQVIKLEMNKWYKIEENRYLFLIDANHCPGAVCFIFKINGLFYLHTGDFRASDEFYNQFKRLNNVVIYSNDNFVIKNEDKNQFYNFFDNLTKYKTLDRVFCKRSEVNKFNDKQIIEKKFFEAQKHENNDLRKFYTKDDTYINKNGDCYAKNCKISEIFVNHNYDVYTSVKKKKINNIFAGLSQILQNDLAKVTEKYTLLDLKYENIFLDNTYEHYKFFDRQEKIIHEILIIIDGKSRQCLAPINYKYLFATYSVGKEKIFLSVAEYLDCFVHVEKRKMDLYRCFDKYVTEKIDKEVKNIVENYKINKKNKNDIRYFLKPVKEDCVKSENLHCYDNIIVKKTKGLDNAIANIDSKNVFMRLTEKKTKNSIELISMMHINKNKIQELCKKYDNDRICIFVGSGWNEKVVYYDFTRKNSTVVKKGIEIHFLPYSEHSSDVEINQFKKMMNYGNIVNTVKNT